ncbi:membrane-associated proteins in eicosanoid and glutathione metabolism [Infundibulicybe gibba]|nr:membrane-associated proteins in eicosanoid and glutathione metabolism [Infundibulicybe gibba]
MTSITLPQGYGYVAASIMTTIPLLMAQNILVSKNRKRSGIKYPQLYAEKAEAEASPAAFKFNCAQRTHQNTLEFIPIILTTARSGLNTAWCRTLLSGLKYPIPSAIACAYWSLSRISYTRNYIKRGPDQRSSSPLVALSYIGFWGLLYGSFHATWNLVSGGL